MPIGKLINDTERTAELYAKLVAEWKWPSVSLEEDAPVLIEEEKPVKSPVAYQPLHIYAIWNEWADVSPQERSEILMDAYAKTHPANVRRVILTMGLTHAEAQKMGLKYKTISSGGTNIK